MTRQSTIRPYPSKNFDTSSERVSGGRPTRGSKHRRRAKADEGRHTTEVKTSGHGGKRRGVKFNSRAEFESQAQLVRALPRVVHVTFVT